MPSAPRRARRTSPARAGSRRSPSCTAGGKYRSRTPRAASCGASTPGRRSPPRSRPPNRSPRAPPSHCCTTRSAYTSGCPGSPPCSPRARSTSRTVQMIVTRTLLAVEPAVMAAIDAEVADTIRAWGGLSIYKTQTAIDRIVERHDPEARRRTESAVRSRCVDIKHGSKVAYLTGTAHRRCRAAGSAIDRDVQIRLRRRSARYRSAARRRARRAGGRTNGTGVRLRIHRMPRRGQRFPALGCRACGGRGGDARGCRCQRGARHPARGRHHRGNHQSRTFGRGPVRGGHRAARGRAGPRARFGSGARRGGDLRERAGRSGRPRHRGTATGDSSRRLAARVALSAVEQAGRLRAVPRPHLPLPGL